METKFTPPIFKVQEDYEVIGQGGMIAAPTQIGEWWVMPASDYSGKIPPQIQQKLFAFLETGIEVAGFLVAEDMRVVEAKRKQEETKKEALKKAAAIGLGVALTPFITLGLGMVTLVAGLLAFDPMLIAVLPTGEWLCLGTWYD